MANPKRIEFPVLEHFRNMKIKKAYENRLFFYLSVILPVLFRSFYNQQCAVSARNFNLMAFG